MFFFFTPEKELRRLIQDCRWLNVRCEDRPFGLDAFADFMKRIRRGDYLWSIDMKSAYFHVLVHLDFVELLGFCWRGRYYVFAVLPFGLKTSAWAFCKVSAVPARIIRERNLVDALCHYIDDLLASAGQTRDFRRAALAVQVVLDLGFVLNPDKLHLELRRILEGLGHVVNTETMTVTLTERRRRKWAAAADLVIANQGSVDARVVARVAGQASSDGLVFGLESRLRARYMLRWVATTAVGGDYRRRAPISGRALAEVVRCARVAREFVERPMHEHLREATWVIECDASDSAVAGIVRRSPLPEWVGRKIRRLLRPDELGKSSTLREMRGYAHVGKLLEVRGVLTAADVIEYVGDSKCAEAIFRKGGSQADYDETADELLSRGTVGHLRVGG